MPRTKRISDDDLLLRARRFLLQRRGRADLNALARTLRLSPATLFHRFGSREKLIRTALGPHHHPALRVPPPGQGPLSDVLVEFGEALDAYFSEMLPAVEVLQAEGIDAQSLYRIGKLPSSVVGHRALTKLIAAERRDADAGTVAAAFIGAVLWRAHGVHHFGTDFDDQPARPFLARLVAQLLPEKPVTAPRRRGR